MRKVALAIIRNRQGQYLLQHKDSGAPNYPDTWCLFGGGVEEGESPEEAIVREVFEELQIMIDIPNLYRRIVDHAAGVDRYFFDLSISEPVEKLKSQLCEGDDVAYFDFSSLKSLKTCQPHMAVIDTLG